MATTLPHTNISASTQPDKLVGLLNTNFQATNIALSERLAAHRITVTGYTATGATSTKMTLGSTSPQGSTPWAVILVRARESRNPGADISVATRLNFSREGALLYVYEPSGLVQYTAYDLDFLVLE